LAPTECLAPSGSHVKLFISGNFFEKRFLETKRNTKVRKWASARKGKIVDQVDDCCQSMSMAALLHTCLRPAAKHCAKRLETPSKG
jgi:hypothetical protein